MTGQTQIKNVLPVHFVRSCEAIYAYLFYVVDLANFPYCLCAIWNELCCWVDIEIRGNQFVVTRR